MTIEKKARWIAGVLTGLLLLTITSTAFYYNSGQNYRSEADKARLSRDSVLAVKQLLDKEVQDMKIDLLNVKGHNEELDKKLSDSELALQEKQNLIDKLMAENATVFSLRKQLKALKADHATMEKQIQDLLAENQQLQSLNASLVQNVSRLEKDKLALQEQLNLADKLNSKAGNFRIDMLHNSNKVTAKSKRTNEIGISFDLPANLSDENPGNKEMYLVILDPQGKPVQNKSNKNFTLKNGNTVSAIKTQIVEWSKNPQTIKMNIKMENKIRSKGVYKIQVYTEDGMIGASQMRMN
jgi:hypothetical protein